MFNFSRQYSRWPVVSIKPDGQNRVIARSTRLNEGNKNNIKTYAPTLIVFEIIAFDIQEYKL